MTRTNTNYGAIFRLFILCGNRRWTEKDESEEEEESERQPGEEASGVRPCWTRHDGGRELRVQSETRFNNFYGPGHVAT